MMIQPCRVASSSARLAAPGQASMAARTSWPKGATSLTRASAWLVQGRFARILPEVSMTHTWIESLW